MAKEICISSTPHETRLAILEDDELAEIYYERENEYTLAGSIYKGRVTRVLPGMQSAFVDIGLERDAFLYVTDFLEEQEDSADFERVSTNGQQPRRDGGQRESRSRQQDEPAQTSAGSASSEGDSEDEESPAGTRKWRGRRGRRRGFRGRGSQEQENTSLESPEIVEEAITAEPVVLPERGAPGGVPAQHLPIVLPGESLSRYGAAPTAREEKPREKAAVAGINYVAPKPSTLIDAPIAWDGSALLPGESRSRRGHMEPVIASEPVAGIATEAARVVEDAQAAVVEDTEVSVHETSPVEHETAHETAVADVAEAAPHVVTESVPLVLEEQEEPETIEEVHEFEPEHASASYRVDPAAPSEFRVFESRVAEVEEEAEPHPVTEHEAQTLGDDAVIEAQAQSAATASETEEAVVAEDGESSETVDHIYGFAPGSGVLEEETIEEEEYDFEPLHVHHDEQDAEELEEETLDNAGTIGDVVRDAHIDQRLAYNKDTDTEEDEFVDEPETGFAEIDEDESEEEDEEAETEAPGAEAAAPQRDGDRRSDRRGDNRRGGRGRQQGRRRHGGRRPSVQTMDLPIISELLKQGQEILVQIAKEPIAKKGARITSHIALPGRFLVFMPTVNHVGVSRKISSDEERQRLKRILISEKGTNSGGFIVRTAADGASEDELRADIRFLISLWNEIKQRSDDGKAPALIYHDLNLVERVLRDQVSDNFSTIWVDSETEYERIVRFLNRFQPSLVRRVKLYTKETPLFEQFGIQDEISKALKSKVWLKSGGSIVINQTEALVAIDINTGKYVGKTARLEDTILKTNLDAIPEIVRQIRLRDLGGIIVIDFIDMDERKNRHKVMQALEEELKHDRAPSKVLQFNDFGLVAITRKRVKQSLERTLSTPCTICTGTGMVKSPTTVANEIFVEMRKMQRHLERNDVMLRVNPEVVKTLKANNARWLNEIEEMVGKTIIVKSDPTLHPEQFDIH